MKRRSFLSGLLGLIATPALPRSLAPEITPLHTDYIQTGPEVILSDVMPPQRFFGITIEDEFGNRSYQKLSAETGGWFDLPAPRSKGPCTIQITEYEDDNF